MTATGRGELRGLLTAAPDAFEPSTRERVLAAVEKRRPRLADPALPGTAPGSTRWREAKGEVFVDGPSAKDPVQGKLGDCYLVATLASLAHSDPEAIRQMVQDNGDGTFDVRFYKMVAYQGRPVTVTVDADLPASGLLGRKQLGADARTELWVGLTEKAYAQWRGSLGAIANGGQPDEIMALVTGRPHWRTAMYNFTLDEVFAKIESQLSRGGLVVAATPPQAEQPELRGSGLAANHAYSVLGVSTESGERFVILRNPWGRGEPGDDGANDGVFKLPLAQFHGLFQSLYTGQVP